MTGLKSEYFSDIKNELLSNWESTLVFVSDFSHLESCPRVIFFSKKLSLLWLIYNFKVS
jgi:hypothetical protein